MIRDNVFYLILAVAFLLFVNKWAYSKEFDHIVIKNTNVCKVNDGLASKNKPKVKYKKIIKYKTRVKKVIKYHTVVKKQKKNRVRLILAHAPNDAVVDLSNNKVFFRKKVVGGLGYSRNLNDTFSVGVDYLFNDTLSVNLGIGF